MLKWSEECQKAFLEIKSCLSKVPVLQPPDLTKPFFYGWMQVLLVLVQS